MRSFFFSLTAPFAQGLARADPQCALPSRPATAILPVVQLADPAAATTAGLAIIPAESLDGARHVVRSKA